MVQRSLLDTIGPSYQRSFVAQHYACLKGRGPQRAALAHLNLQRRTAYRLHLDVRAYFQSVRLDLLLELFAARLKDPQTLALIAQLLAHGATVYQQPLAHGKGPPLPDQNRRGLPLGSYLSQWSGAMYLSALDHFVLRELKPAGYLRYMDDFVLFDHSTPRLEAHRRAIADWLHQERDLELNPKHQRIFSRNEPSLFLGYRLSPAGISPSRKLRRRFSARLRAAAEHSPAALQRTLAAYRGLLLFGAGPHWAKSASRRNVARQPSTAGDAPLELAQNPSAGPSAGPSAQPTANPTAGPFADRLSRPSTNACLDQSGDERDVRESEPQV